MRDKLLYIALFLSWTYWQTNIVPGLTFQVSASPDLANWSLYSTCAAADMDATAQFTQQIEIVNEAQTFTLAVDSDETSQFFTVRAFVP